MRNLHLLSLLSLSTIIACNAGDFFSDTLQQEIDDYLKVTTHQEEEKLHQQKEYFYQYPHLALAQYIITDLSTNPNIDLDLATQSLSSRMKNEHAQKDMLLLSTCYNNIKAGQSLSYSPHNSSSLLGKSIEKESRNLITAIINHSAKLANDGKPYELYKPTDAQQFEKYKEALSNR